MSQDPTTTDQGGVPDNQQSDIDSAVNALVQWLLPSNVVENVPVNITSVKCTKCNGVTTHHWFKIFPDINPNIPDAFYDPDKKFKLQRPSSDDVADKARRLICCCRCGELSLKK